MSGRKGQTLVLTRPDQVVHLKDASEKFSRNDITKRNCGVVNLVELVEYRCATRGQVVGTRLYGLD